MKRFQVYLALMLLLGCTSKVEQKDITRIEITLELEMGKDLGQSLGSLFEIFDNKGKIKVRAGYQDYYGTWFRHNNRMMSFSVLGEDSTLQKTDLPSFHDVKSTKAAVHIFTMDNILYGSHRAQFRSENYEWSPGKSSWKKSTLTHEDGSLYPQKIGDQVVRFHSTKGLSIDGKKIPFKGKEYTTADYYLNGNKLAVALNKSNGDVLFVCDYILGEPLPDLDAVDNNCVHTPTSLRSDVYAFANLDGTILMGKGDALIMSYKDQKFEVIQKSKGDWQPYSMIRYYDSILIGQYPTGSLFRYRNGKMTKFDPPVPIPVGASSEGREAQSISYYGGRLVVGVWPWGELWELDESTSSWKSLGRAFQMPEKVEGIGPYADKDVPVQGEVFRNIFGQRIIDLVSLDGDLFVGKASRLSEFPMGFPKLISQNQQMEYKKVTRYSGYPTLSRQLPWKATTTLKFSIAKTGLSAYQDGVLIGKSEVPVKNLFRASPLKVKLGEGAFGPFAGKIKDSKIEFFSQP